MPVEVRYLDGGKGAVFLLSGFVTGEEVIAANRQIYSRDFAAEPYLYTFVDCDDIEGMNVSTMQVREIAQQHIGASKNLRNHVLGVYAKNDLPFALARMWQVFVESTGWDTRAFRVRSEAVDWVKQRALDKFDVAITLE